MKYLLSTILIFCGDSAQADITFVCEWQISDPSYSVEITVDDVAMTATRSDSDTKYNVIQINKHGVWLVVTGGENEIAAIQTIERSVVGGRWTDNWLWNSGDSNPTKGGYCIEEPANE